MNLKGFVDPVGVAFFLSFMLIFWLATRSVEFVLTAGAIGALYAAALDRLMRN